MYGTIRTVHQWLGYAVFLVVLVVAVLAWIGSRRSTKPALPRARTTMVLLDVHVTIGIVLYAVGAWWAEGDAPLVAYVHPTLAIAALGVGHAALARARRADNAAAADRGLAVGFTIVLVLITAAIGVASMGTMA
ncbi:MAG: hypothetical protein RLZZ272_334 [Actinomycetota bacterium]